jgi:hypothetical protein
MMMIIISLSLLTSHRKWIHVHNCLKQWKFYPVFSVHKGRDSSVCIATGYGLHGPGIESRWGRDFPHTSRPALGPTQPPVQWIPGLSRG